MYLMWYDETPKRTQEQKIRDAMEAYRKHFFQQPNLVLVNHEETITLPDVIVRGVSYVRKNNVWAGWEPQP